RFNGSIIDAGSLDTHQVMWEFGDGSVIPFHSASDPGAMSVQHVYHATGTYVVRMTVRDDHGGMADDTRTITIRAVGLDTDPIDSTKVALYVGGTPDDDSIHFVQKSDGPVYVSLNGVWQGPFQVTGHLIAFGDGGNDSIVVSGRINLPTM